MSNRISFDQYTEERKDNGVFPVPPEHAQEERPLADGVLSERVKTAEAEGRWGDSLALKLTDPQPVQGASTGDGDDGGDGEASDEWGVSQWDDKSGFFDPPPSQVVSDSNDDGQDGQDGQDANANDDSNDEEDDQ